jgi:hypothetical protein
MLRLLVSVLAVALIWALTMIGNVLMWVPEIVRTAWRVTSMFIALSCVGYRALFELVARRLQWWFVLRQPWRTLLSMALSVALICGALLLAQWEITPAALAIAAIHGLIVGMAWDSLGPPDGQSLGR